MAHKRPALPEGYDPHLKIKIGSFTVQLGSFHYNAWLVWKGLTSHEEMTPEQLAFWKYLNGPRKKFTGGIKYMASNKLAPKPLPPITIG